MFPRTLYNGVHPWAPIGEKLLISLSQECCFVYDGNHVLNSISVTVFILKVSLFIDSNNSSIPLTPLLYFSPCILDDASMINTLWITGLTLGLVLVDLSLPSK